MIREFHILDALSQGVFCIDKEYRIIYWNTILEFWSGIRAENALGEDLFTTFPAMDKKFYRLMIRQVFEAGTTAIFSYQLHKDLFKFDSPDHNVLCIQSQIVRTSMPGKENEYSAVFSLQDISGLISQIEINREVKDQVMELVEELKRTNEELLKAASTDPLTGLSNRRSMMEYLNGEVERSKRYGKDFSLLLTDIDNFKSFNDSYGHACGDYILSELGKLFHSIIRPTDRISRWGGEEFLFLLPETDSKAAGLSAERIRTIVENHQFQFEGNEQHVSLSFGVSCSGEKQDLNQLINQADQALYKAKKEGKNRVVLYSKSIK